MAETYVVKEKDGIEVVIDMKKPDHEPGMTNRLLKLEKSFDTLRPKAQARVLWARRFRRMMSETGTTQQDLGRIIDTPPSSISSWANAVSMPGPDAMDRLSEFFGEDASLWAEAEKKEMPPVQEASPSPASSLIITDEEEALIRRVRRMSEEERNALFTLLHVLR